MSRITDFYRISPPAPGREMDDDARSKYYRRLRLQAFVAATLGYSLYYVCRTSLNVMKKPILDSGSLDASQLGVIGSALLFAYAVGKFVNGFIADYCNIKRFMATGLIVSAAANALMGLLGLAHSVVPTAVIFAAFAVMWGLNGWAQSMGAPRPSYPSRGGIPSGNGEPTTDSSPQAITSGSSSRSSSWVPS